MIGSPGVITVIIIIKTDVFLLEGKESSPSPLFCSFKKKITHLTFVRSHFGKQGLRHLGPLHLLLDLVINGGCDVDVGTVHLHREVCCRCRGFGLPRDHENNNLKVLHSEQPSVQKLSEGFSQLMPNHISYRGTLPVHYSNQVNCDWK